MLIALLWALGLTSFAQTKKDSLQLVHLQEVQVVSSRATETTPFTYSNMDKKAIDKANFGQDIPFLLTLTPSVVATSDAGTGIGYTGFRIRGTDANRINITANGIPMNDAESHGVFWVNIPDFASSLEDFQVQRGVGTSTNGAGAFGASVNMKTENIPANPYGEVNGSYGSFNAAKATLKLGTGQLGNHWAFDARLSTINSDGYIDRASVNLQSYFAQAGYYNGNTLLKFILFGGKEKTYHAWDGVPKDSLKTNRTYNPSGYMGVDANGKPLYYDNQTDNYIQTNYQLHLLQVINPFLKLNAALHYTKGDGYYEEYKDKRKLIEYGLSDVICGDDTLTKSDLVRQKHLDNGFGGMVFSLDYKKNQWDVSLGGGANYYEGNHFGRVTWIKNYAGDTSFYPEHEYYRSKAKKADANLFLKANYQLNTQWNVYADLQYRYIDYKIEGQNDVWDWQTGAMQQLDIHEKFNFFNPKAGILYQINASNNLFASFAVAHREPNRNNYTDANPGKMPKPEQLSDYELGYKFQNNRWIIGANLYYMQYKDQLVLTGKVNEIGEMLTSNIPDSYRMGIELQAGAQICKELQWNGNLTLSRNRIKNFTESVDLYVQQDPNDDDSYEWSGQIDNALGDTPISFSPDIIANSLFHYQWKAWDAALMTSYVGKQYINNTGSDDRKLDPYFVNNLRLGYTFHLENLKSLSVNLLVNNLFNEQYESNAWVYSSYSQAAGGTTQYRSEDFGYFPQAGTNVMANVVVKF